MAEIINASSNNVINKYLDSFGILVRALLCDDVESVRIAASAAFEALLRVAGRSAVDVIVHPLLGLIENKEESEQVLLGIEGILRVKSGAILHHIVPSLLTFPITAFKARALATLGEVAGDGLIGHVEKIVQTFFISLESEDLSNSIVLEYLSNFVVNLSGANASKFVDIAVRQISSCESVNGILCGVLVLESFCRRSRSSYEDFLLLIYRPVLRLLRHGEDGVKIGALKCLLAIVNTVPIEILSYHTSFLKNELYQLLCDERGRMIYDHIPALGVASSFDGLLPIFQHSLLYGTPEDREDAASAIRILIEYCPSLDVLKPYVIKIAGPLIRIVGDRFHSSVKCAILKALFTLLQKSGVLMKPFVPQLQTTFVKALAEPSEEVRDAAAYGLAELMKLNVRKVDWVVAELVSLIESADGGIKASAVVALSSIICMQHCESVDKLLELAKGLLSSAAEEVRSAAGLLFGACGVHLDPHLISNDIDILLSISEGDVVRVHGTIMAINGVMKFCAQKIDEKKNRMCTFLLKMMSHKSESIRLGSINAGFSCLFSSELCEEKGDNIFDGLFFGLVGKASDESENVRLQVVKSIQHLSKKKNEFVVRHIRMMIPILLERALDENLTVKLEMETALFYAFGCLEGPDVVASRIGLLDTFYQKEVTRILSKK